MLGLYVRARGVGYAHVPSPIELDDLVATEHGEFRVVDVVESPPGYAIQALVKMRPARLAVAAR